MLKSVEKLNWKNLVDVTEIGNLFTAEVGYAPFNFEHFSKQWGPMLAGGIGEIFAIRDGERVIALLGSVYVPDSFSGVLTACEQFWYVLPEYRGVSIAGQLFDAFEAEAKNRGCRKILMVRLETPQADKLDALYTRRGYKPIEKTFGKEII